MQLHLPAGQVGGHCAALGSGVEPRRPTRFGGGEQLREMRALLSPLSSVELREALFAAPSWSTRPSWRPGRTSGYGYG